MYQEQAILAGSLTVTVVVARLALAVRLRAVDVAAVVALGVLATSSGPQEPARLSSAVRFGLAAVCVPVAVAGWVGVRRGPPGASAALAGLAFGGTALCARALILPVLSPPDLPMVLGTLAADPLVWGLLGFGGTGMPLYAHALEHGQVGPVTALLWIVEVAVPSAVGVLLLGDTVRAGWGIAAATAFVAVVAAAAVLANAPAQGLSI
ncbi:hypothetical protein ACFPIJ_00080 [Dactylosporangium cerinum]|uniref:Integral membrane protein n=1 Tax=Dactylosporangium cerinum TaxID=1434730 RepID=A0ABV9VLI6_9ACTN